MPSEALLVTVSCVAFATMLFLLTRASRSPLGLDLDLSVVDPSVVLIALVGALDGEGARRVEAALARARRTGARRLVVDLSELAFVDSTSLGFLVREQDLVARSGGKLILLAPRPKVRVVLELLGLDQHLDIRPNLEGALA